MDLSGPLTMPVAGETWQALKPFAGRRKRVRVLEVQEAPLGVNDSHAVRFLGEGLKTKQRWALTYFLERFERVLEPGPEPAAVETVSTAVDDLPRWGVTRMLR